MKWSLFHYVCFGCVVVLLLNIVFVGSALFSFFGLWIGIRVVREKFDAIDKQAIVGLMSRFQSSSPSNSYIIWKLLEPMEGDFVNYNNCLGETKENVNEFKKAFSGKDSIKAILTWIKRHNQKK